MLESPVLPGIVDRLEARLAEERARRERFYAEIIPGVKAACVNGKVIMPSARYRCSPLSTSLSPSGSGSGSSRIG